MKEEEIRKDVQTCKFMLFVFYVLLPVNQVVTVNEKWFSCDSLVQIKVFR